MLLFLSLLLSVALDLNCLELSSKAKHRVAFILSGSPSHRPRWGVGEGLGEAIIKGIITREILFVST